MKVKLLVALAKPTGGYRPGEEYQCSKDEAERLIAKGFAEPIKTTRKTTKKAKK